MHDLSGSVARSPLLAGEPITAQKLIKAGRAASLLPSCRKACARSRRRSELRRRPAASYFPTTTSTSFLFGGCTVAAARTRSVVDTLFRNVRVIAIGQQIETKEGKKAADSSASTATLELTPRQAEMMALANAMGDITLSLRSVADLSTDPRARRWAQSQQAEKQFRACRPLRREVACVWRELSKS